MSNLFAVYGTLKKGFHNNYLMNNAKYLGKTLTEPSYTMVSLGGYPGVIEGGNTQITCEIWEVPEEDQPDIDRLEGYPGWYDKVKIPTEFGEAHMYTLDKSYLDNLEVSSGEWL